MAIRTCRVCGLEAHTEEELKLFTPHKISPYGRSNICIKCKGTYKRLWRARNREKMRQKSRDYREKIRIKVIQLYGGKCACCGETSIEFLTLDHIQGGGRKEDAELGTYGVYKKARDLFHSDKEKALKTYRILCYNCNCSIGRYGYCPHNQKTNNPNL